MMSRDEKKVLGGLAACHGVNHLFFESLGPLLPFIIPTFSLTYTQAGRLGLVYYVSYGVFSYPAGHWADRHGRKMMIFLFLLISSIATLLMGLSHSFWQLILFCALAGFGGGLYHPSGTSLGSEVVPIAQRGTALGIHGSGGSMGILLTFVLGGGTASLFGWRAALIVLSMVGFALLVWFRLAIGLQDKKIRLEQSETFVLPMNSGFFPLVRAVLIFFIIYGMVMVIFKGAYTWIPTYLKETFHISASKAIIFSIILPLVGISSNIVMGKFSDQYGRKRSLIIAFWILSLCFFFLFLGSRPFLIPLLIILGFFLNCFASVTNAYTADLIPPDLRGKAFGLIFAFSICLSAFSPYIMGWISDRTSLSGGILFLSAASLMAGFISMVGPEMRKKIISSSNPIR